MRTIKLTLAYDGTAYAGWQSQPGVTTVQGLLEAALEKITGAAARTLASGRTDAGVHALAQVVSFRTQTHLSGEVLRRAINANLPDDVVIHEAVDVPAAFHPIRDVIRKGYRYAIHDGPLRDVFRRRYCWQVPRRLDADPMSRAAAALLGTHDFAAFQTQGAPRRSTVRTVYRAELCRECQPQADFLTFQIEANGFLYNMVRAIVGSLVEIGRGAQSEDWMAKVLASADRRQAGPTAPPQGLFLESVVYGEPGGASRGGAEPEEEENDECRNSNDEGSSKDE
ncbi:MAG: tRNA pseudouridine(38-40) synthase TruA [Chthoniobacteraceae bacterium]